MKKLFATLLILLLAAGLFACTVGTEDETDLDIIPLAGVDALLQELRDAGLEFTVYDNEVEQHLSALFPTAQHYPLMMGDSVRIYVIAFADEQLAQHHAAFIDPFGSSIANRDAGTSMRISWAGPIRWHQSDNLIAYYVGTDHAMIALMAELMGPHFAGAGFAWSDDEPPVIVSPHSPEI